MTTIAYRDGVLAADTIGTRNGARDGIRIKIARRGRLLAGGAGSCDYTSAFHTWFLRGCVGECPQMGDPSGNWAEGFVILPDDRIATFGPKSSWIDDAIYCGVAAWGSGAEYAIGAMLAGASPAEAVRAAILFDIHSGGDVTVLKVGG